MATAGEASGVENEGGDLCQVWGCEEVQPQQAGAQGSDFLMWQEAAELAMQGWASVSHLHGTCKYWFLQTQILI